MENLFYGYVDNGFEIELSRECVEDCCHRGDCEEDCQRWIEIPEIKKQFDKIPKERLINHILEYGCNKKTELQKWDKKRLSIWVLWSICGDIYDSEEFNI